MKRVILAALVLTIVGLSADTRASYASLVRQPAQPSRIQLASCAPQPPGMIAWWRGERNTEDSAGQHGGQLVGGATFADGEVGTAFSLDGQDDWISVPDSADWAFGVADFTIDAWILRSPQGSDRAILGQSSDANHWWRFALFAFGSDSRLRFQASDGAGPPPLNLGSIRFTFTDNVWHHVAVTRTGVTGWMFYIDGVPLPPADPADIGFVALEGPVPDLTGPLAIGGQAGVIPLFLFPGLLDEVEVLHRALAPSEIRNLHAAAADGKCLPPSRTDRPNVGGPVGAIAAAAAPAARANRERAGAQAPAAAIPAIVPPSTGDAGLAARPLR